MTPYLLWIPLSTFTFCYIFSLTIIGFISYALIEIDTLKNNTIRNAFLTYGFNDMLMSDTEDEEYEEIDTVFQEQTQSIIQNVYSDVSIKPIINNEQREEMFKIYDIIKITFSNHCLDDETSKHHRVRRSISTYGYEEILPDENTEYVITNVEKYGEIPNVKDKSNIEKSDNNTDCYIYVFPLKLYDDDNYDIFWFINLTKMTICQFEDAYPIENLSCIFRVGSVPDKLKII